MKRALFVLLVGAGVVAALTACGPRPLIEEDDMPYWSCMSVFGIDPDDSPYSVDVDSLGEVDEYCREFENAWHRMEEKTDG